MTGLCAGTVGNVKFVYAFGKSELSFNQKGAPMNRFVIALAMCFSTQVHAQSINDRVVELMTEYGVALKEHYAKPFAFVATGDQVLLSQQYGATERDPHWWVHAKKGKKELSARGYQFVANGRVTENWKMRRFDGVKVTYATGKREDRRKDVDDEDELEERDRHVPVWPLGLATGKTGYLDYHVADRLAPAKWFLKCDVADARYEDGDLVATYILEYKTVTHRYTIRFGKDHNWLPIRGEKSAKDPRDPDSEWKGYGGVTTTWKRHKSGQWLPEKMETQHIALSLNEEHFSMEFKWLIGDEVTDDLIVSDHPDWRAKIASRFEVTWLPIGRFPLASTFLEE